MSDPILDYATPKTARFKIFLRKIGPAGPVAAFATVMPIVGTFAAVALAPMLSQWLAAHRPMSIFVYAGCFALLAGFALVPTYANALVGGWTFKFPVGFPAVMAGLSGAAVISYFVAHWIVGHRVTNTLHEHPKWEVVRDALIGGRTLKVFAIVALLRISPILPFSTTNVLLASCEVRFWPFLFGTVIGAAPRQAAIVYIASRASRLDLDAPQATWLAIASILGTIIVIIVLAIISKHALDRATRGRAAGV